MNAKECEGMQRIEKYEKYYSIYFHPFNEVYFTQIK